MIITPIIALMMVMILFIVFIVIVLAVLYNRTFKNRAIIARQTGKDVSDVIWIEDKFRVKNREGLWIIEFRKMRQKTLSIDGKFWTKFIKKKKQAGILKYTKEEWDGLELSKKIQRGIFFYETTEGEFFPMEIRDVEGKPSFSLITQDNRQFIINETQDVNSLTRNKKRDTLVLVALIVGIIVIAFMFVFGIIYMNETTKTNMAAIGASCSQGIQQAYINATKTDPTFLSTATGMVGG